MMSIDAELLNVMAATGHDPVELLRKLRASGSPIILSINGHAPVEVADEESYQLALRLFDRLETIAGIKAGVSDFEQGQGGLSWEEIHEEIVRKHGTPN